MTILMMPKNTRKGSYLTAFKNRKLNMAMIKNTLIFQFKLNKIRKKYRKSYVQPLICL